MQERHPTTETAAAAVEHALGWTPSAVRRFSTGAAHYVFEALPAGGNAVVVRMGSPAQREEMQHGLRLVERLRLLGVPLPAVIAHGLDRPLPYVLIERLPGADLGYVMRSLSDEQLGTVAVKIADAQRATSRFGSAGRYGYAAEAELAPHAAWSAVLEANIERSRRRITAAGLFDLACVEAVIDLVKMRRAELDSLPAVPLLHDTTTRNVIVTEEGVFSGVVDVDDLCFGDPRYAAALTLAVMLAHGGPVGYVQAWMKAAGHADDRLFRLYVAMFLLDLMSEHGQTFNGNECPSMAEEREGVLRAFTQAIQVASA